MGEDRMFDHSLKVCDSKYTMMEIPSGYTYPTDTNVAVFYNLLPDGKYYGFSPGDTPPPNAYCVTHSSGYYAPYVPDGYDPGMYDPGMYDPGMYDPGMYDPGMYNPGYLYPDGGGYTHPSEDPFGQLGGTDTPDTGEVAPGTAPGFEIPGIFGAPAAE